jgi:hypothetical protein
MQAVIFFSCFLCVLYVSAANLHAQAADPLKQFEPFIGAWVAEGELPGVGKYAAERAYRWTLDGKFIEMEQHTRAGEFRSVVRAILGWHPGEKKILAWGFADDGTISLTECDCDSGETFQFAGRLIGGADPGPVRGSFRRIAPDAFVETIEAQRDGAWQPHGRFEFRRRPAPAVPAPLSTRDPVEALRPLEPLVGVWTQTSTFSGGIRYTVEFEFRWVLGGKFLLSEYRVLGTENAGLHALSFTGYNAEAGRLMQYGFSADGTLIAARVSVSGSEPVVVFEGDMVGRQRRTLRTTWRRHDADTLASLTEFQHLGIFQPAGNATLRRKIEVRD